jgi:hypothetical protein
VPTSDWEIIQIKEMPGKKKVTQDQKNALIERAVSIWEDMGLTNPEIAFATTVMGQESGFDAKAKGKTKDSDEYGLGQFTEGTWGEAVKQYNIRYKPGIDNAATARKNPDAQIRVMGVWVPHIWEKAGEVTRDPKLKGYEQEQIAYGIWNKGPDADPEDVGDYLNHNWHDPNTGGYFDTNYDRAMQGLSLRKDYLDLQRQREAEQSGGSGWTSTADASNRPEIRPPERPSHSRNVDHYTLTAAEKSGFNVLNVVTCWYKYQGSYRVDEYSDGRPDVRIPIGGGPRHEMVESVTKPYSANQNFCEPTLDLDW